MRRVKEAINPQKQIIAERRLKARRKEEKELRAAVPKGTDFKNLNYFELQEIGAALNWSTGRVQKTAERIARKAKEAARRKK